MKIIATTSAVELIRGKLKNLIFDKLTSNSPNIFLRGGDVISRTALIEGIHEKSLTKLIQEFSKQGLSDFFIDIGANIGLNSCQSGSNFKKIVCFEPNPLCVHILKANLEISLIKDSFAIYEYALGESDCELELHIPKNNWGGAFIKSTNCYSEEVLAAKDGFKTLNTNNYIKKIINVKSATNELKYVFNELKSNGFKNGVIKIDVEGYEKYVLEGIAKSIPPEFEVVICFENWDPNFNFKSIVNKFIGRKVEVNKLERSLLNRKNSKIFKLFNLALGLKDRHVYINLEQASSNVGDLFFELKK